MQYANLKTICMWMNLICHFMNKLQNYKGLGSMITVILYSRLMVSDKNNRDEQKYLYDQLAINYHCITFSKKKTTTA